MTIHSDRLEEIMTQPLQSGGHPSMADGMCVMEAVSYVAGEPWSDHPQCVCPVIATFLRSWNDGLSTDRDRDRLLRPLIPRIVGSRSSAAVEERRAWMACDWLVREHTPMWLELAGLTEHAQALRETAELVDAESFAARAAAWAAAWDASRAAAMDAARDAAWAAAWDAAWAAAWDASRAAARAAAWGAAWDDAWDDAMDASRAAAWAAARATVAKLEPTVEQLQASALRLIDRMLAVADTEVA